MMFEQKNPIIAAASKGAALDLGTGPAGSESKRATDALQVSAELNLGDHIDIQIVEEAGVDEAGSGEEAPKKQVERV